MNSHLKHNSRAENKGLWLLQDSRECVTGRSHDTPRTKVIFTSSTGLTVDELTSTTTRVTGRSHNAENKGL